MRDYLRRLISYMKVGVLGQICGLRDNTYYSMLGYSLTDHYWLGLHFNIRLLWLIKLFHSLGLQVYLYLVTPAVGFVYACSRLFTLRGFLIVTRAGHDIAFTLRGFFCNVNHY